MSKRVSEQLKTNRLTPIYASNLPKKLKDSSIYISYKYEITVHNCACGCGIQIIAKTNEENYRLTTQFNKDAVTLDRPIYNESCGSLYEIVESKVIWLEP